MPKAVFTSKVNSFQVAHTVTKYLGYFCKQICRHQYQRTLTIGGSITVQLTFSLTGLDSAKQLKLMLIHHKQSSIIKTK